MCFWGTVAAIKATKHDAIKVINAPIDLFRLCVKKNKEMSDVRKDETARRVTQAELAYNWRGLLRPWRENGQLNQA